MAKSTEIALPQARLLARFRHKGTQGARLAGWPEINTEKLAKVMRVHPMHLRDVLTGRVGTTTKYLEKIMAATGLAVSEIVRRTELARAEEEVRVEAARRRWEERQLRRRGRSTLR